MKATMNQKTLTANTTKKFVIDGVENIGKGENAGLPAVSPLLTVFSKQFFSQYH